MARPSEYKSEMCQIALDLMKVGASIVEVCAELGIDRQTFYNWINPEHDNYNEEFFDTVSRGRVLCQAWWEKNGRTNLTNKDFNAKLWRDNVTCRFRDDWTERKELKLDGDINVEVVKIGNKEIKLKKGK